MAEWWYNSTYHSSIRMSPFEAMYGYPPVQVQFHQLVSGGTGDLNQFVQSRASMLAAIKVNLTLAKERMKHFADLKRSEREFNVGDWVFLKLHPYRQSSLAMRTNQKLAPRFYGPFQISSKIGQVAYRLNLPPQSLIHPTFHVSLLKKKVGQADVVEPTLPPVGTDGQLLRNPIAILDRKVFKKDNRMGIQVLLRWEGLNSDDATWEDWDKIKKQYPAHILEKLSVV